MKESATRMGYQLAEPFKQPRPPSLLVSLKQSTSKQKEKNINEENQHTDTVKAYRQGDISILTAVKIPLAAQRVAGEPILARGEVTGHTHRITEGKVLLYQLATGLMYLRVLSEFAKLYHEEHEEIILPRGDYEVRQQKEFDWLSEERRYVRD